VLRDPSIKASSDGRGEEGGRTGQSERANLNILAGEFMIRQIQSQPKPFQWPPVLTQTTARTLRHRLERKTLAKFPPPSRGGIDCGAVIVISAGGSVLRMNSSILNRQLDSNTLNPILAHTLDSLP
jgi:hypothetical protein